MKLFAIPMWLVLVPILSPAAAVPDVMNAGGVPYDISNRPGSTKDWRGQPGDYSTNFNENVHGLVEHFDVYGEVRTKYSQVYWTRNTPINLPEALVERFKGKVMAITGYEVDQVTHSGSQPGSTTKGDVLGGFSCYPDCEETDQSVPEYNAYNHHYFSWLTGSDAQLYDRKEAGFPPHRIPNPTNTGFATKAGTSHDFPTNIVFKENPGGEFRKSYHGYPSGYAQLLHSPSQWVVEPMQIDTHNRKYNITEQVGYRPWFLPKVQQNNMTQLNGGLSPLIECPCSDRITRSTEETSQLLTSGTCGSPITSAGECAQAVSSIANVSSSVTVNDGAQPAGCQMVPDEHQLGVYKTVFNAAKSAVECGDRGPFSWVGPTNASAIDCTNGACLKSDLRYGCTGEFEGQCTWDDENQAQHGCSMWDECEGIFCSSQYSKKRLCFARSTGNTRSSTVTADQTWKKVYSNNAKMWGQSNSLVKLTVAHDGHDANITMTGPANVWFAVGFNAKTMADLPYAIVVDGDTGVVSERKLGSHAPGTELTPSVRVLTHSVTNAIRTVVLTRTVEGATKDHYTIPSSAGQINLITAVGATPQLAYHKSKTGTHLTLVPTSTSACVCQPTVHSYLTYMNKSKSEFDGYNCWDNPRSDMLKHGDGTGRDVPNAACHMQTYNGGLKCCTHQNFLTDIEQDTQIPDLTDTYFLKWRYYFQEYIPATSNSAASHKHLHHWVFLIDQAVNDYEEDNAHYGTASVGRITANLTAAEMGLEDTPAKWGRWSPFVMTPHCHAPSCIREELWNTDTGEIICNMTAKYGNKKYGSLSSVFNEEDYIAILPCIYGNQPGLQTPFVFEAGTNITAIKYFNNTYRHLGQMAQWTGMMTYDTDPY